MTNKTSLFSKVLLGASAVALSTAIPAFAQDADDADDGARRMNTVNVTATRREGTTVQDVPIAVTAVDAEALERAGVADIKSLDSVAPSFNMNSSNSESGGTTLRIRGVGTTGNNIGLESSVGVFLDGVYLSRPGIALADLLDLQQVEVLRGPQGTLFGRNTSAGALNITTKKPDLSEAGGFANITLGNYGLFNTQGGANIPIIEDKLGVRISGAVRQRDGFLTNGIGNDINNRDRVTLRGQALADFGGGGEVRLIVDYADGDDECCDAVWERDTAAAGFGLYGLPANGGAPNVGASALDSYDSNGQGNANPFEQYGASLTYEVDLGSAAEMTYIGSYRDYESVGSFRDDDYTTLDVFTTGPSAQAVATGNFDPDGGTQIVTQTHELRFQGTTFNDHLDWLVGVYYSDEQIDSRGSLTLLNDFQSTVSGGLLAGLNPFFAGAYSPGVDNPLLVASGGVSAAGDFATNSFEQSGESMSIFTHNVINVTDNLNFTVGLRYVDESKDGKFEQLDGQHNACNATLANLGNLAPIQGAIDGVLGAGNFNLYGNAVALNCFVFAAPAYDPANPTPLQGAIAASPLAGVLALLGQPYDETFEDDELVYTLKAGYKFNDNLNVFGGFTHGFKSGGFNLDASAGAGGASPQFASEKIDAFELGLKSTFWDGRAVVNVAAFHQEMEDFQVLEFTGTRFQTFNVAKAQSTGIEVESQAQITDNFGANLGVTWTDANYPDDCAEQDPTAAGYLANAAALCGNELTNAPEWVGILGATWEQPIANGDANLFITGSARYESDRRTATQAVETSNFNILNVGDVQEANTKANLRIGVEAPDEKWAVELWGNNIFDERTKNVTFSIPLRGSAASRAKGQFVQDPATYGITLRTKF